MKPVEEVVEPLIMGYTLPSHFEEWKHQIAQKAAQKAQERGIEAKYIIAAMMLESGINPEAVGDGGCSLGVLQLNKCVHKKELTTDQQIDAWLDNFSEAYNKTKTWEFAVTDWNSPVNAFHYWETKYFKLYQAQLDRLTTAG